MNNSSRDFRPNRRRGFDDDTYEPPRRNFGYAPPSEPQFEAPSGPSVRATVKWYNPEKGFGFVQLADGSSSHPEKDSFSSGRLLRRHAQRPYAAAPWPTIPAPRTPRRSTRLWNHRLSAEVGWFCSHSQASSTMVVRSRGLPALDTPCSRSIEPLCHGVGARPA